MSASPVARQAHSHAQLIPAMRKVLISDASQMPDVYSSTPNGTIYSTTPNGKLKTLIVRVFKFHVGTKCRRKKNFCSPLHDSAHSDERKRRNFFNVTPLWSIFDYKKAWNENWLD